MENKLQEYNGIWYMYKPELDAWYLSDREDKYGCISIYSAEYYRIDECINKFISDTNQCYTGSNDVISLKQWGENGLKYYEGLFKNVKFI